MGYKYRFVYVVVRLLESEADCVGGIFVSRLGFG